MGLTVRDYDAWVANEVEEGRVRVKLARVIGRGMVQHETSCHHMRRATMGAAGAAPGSIREATVLKVLRWEKEHSGRGHRTAAMVSMAKKNMSGTTPMAVEAAIVIAAAGGALTVECRDRGRGDSPLGQGPSGHWGCRAAPRQRLPAFRGRWGCRGLS